MRNHTALLHRTHGLGVICTGDALQKKKEDEVENERSRQEKELAHTLAFKKKVLKITEVRRCVLGFQLLRFWLSFGL